MNFADLAVGASYVQKGWQQAKQKELRAYMIVPIIVNVVFFSVMAYLVIDIMGETIGGIDEGYGLPSYLEWARGAIDVVLGAVEALLWLLVGLVMVFLVGTSFTMITHLIVGPFNGVLSEKAEGLQRDLSYPEFSVWKILGRSIARELQKLKYWILRVIPIALIGLIVSFIPLIQLGSPAMWYIFGAWMMAIQYIDIAADNNGLSFKQTLSVLRANRGLILGFGGMVMILTIIPIVNLIIIPVAVVGATMLWVEKLDSKPLGTKSLDTQALETQPGD